MRELTFHQGITMFYWNITIRQMVSGNEGGWKMSARKWCKYKWHYSCGQVYRIGKGGRCVMWDVERIISAINKIIMI